MFTKLRVGLLSLLFVSVLALSPTNSLGARLPKQRCRICRDFVESFERRLEETENSNYAGGDTSWEEEKLGSYANSEVRLVEILDTLCKDHECHSLLEQNEEHIERWWFKLRHKENGDLKMWLCHSHLDVCCPEGTYGPTCTACPGSRENPCSGRGTCLGAEEKEGVGECSCDAEYEGVSCQECAKGYYNESDSCLACDKACKDSCSGSGPGNCEQCAGGYEEDKEGACTDMDECSGDEPVCKDGTYCFNTPGSYRCNSCDKSCEKACAGPGPARCVECGSGYEKDDAGICKDKNECLEDTSLCSEGTYCDNTPGKYLCKACHLSCKHTCSGPGAGNCTECKSGFLRENDTCTDINECSQEPNPCNAETETCENLVGTHLCKCKKGLVRAESECVVLEKPAPPEPNPTKKLKKKKKKLKKGAKSVPREAVQSEAAEANQQQSNDQHEPTHDQHEPTHEPTHDQQVPTHDQHEPTHDQREPTHDQHVPTHDQHVPTHDQHVLTHDQHEPTHDQHVPTHDQHVPTHDKLQDQSHEPSHNQSHDQNKPMQDEVQDKSHDLFQDEHDPIQDKQQDQSHEPTHDQSNEPVYDNLQDQSHDQLQELRDEL